MNKKIMLVGCGILGGLVIVLLIIGLIFNVLTFSKVRTPIQTLTKKEVKAVVKEVVDAIPKPMKPLSEKEINAAVSTAVREALVEEKKKQTLASLYNRVKKLLSQYRLSLDKMRGDDLLERMVTAVQVVEDLQIETETERKLVRLERYHLGRTTEEKLQYLRRKIDELEELEELNEIQEETEETEEAKIKLRKKARARSISYEPEYEYYVVEEGPFFIPPWGAFPKKFYKINSL